ncbi:MAG: hypothetical protein L7H18_04765 [Candidatus Nealsonbacteria bacterium DGGOD1a]|nr:MAG: hypothetical protein L7H18_04765 [Candidatus Nealsonbacteria bacterium DGGOD1a]
MEKNKFNSIFEPLLKPSLKINAILFLLLWIIYCYASFQFSLLTFNGWSGLITIPLSFLFYLLMGIVVPLKIIFNWNQKKSVIFYPVFFTVLVLIPQVLFVFFNTYNDCGDSYCKYNPNFLISRLLNTQIGGPIELLLFVISIISIFTYIAGLIIFLSKIFKNESAQIVTLNEKTLPKLIKSVIPFSLLTGVIAFGAIMFTFVQLGFLNAVFSISLCPLIMNQDNKNLCYRELSIAKQDLTICKKATNRSHDRDYCYEKIGIAKQDLSICDMIEVNYNKEKDFCYEGVGVAKNDLSICDQIKYEPEKVWCYKEIGVARKDTAICDMIMVYDGNSKYQKDECFMRIAAVEQNLEICGEIADQSNKEKCYSGVGIAKQDISICDKITDISLKARCYRGNGAAK